MNDLEEKALTEVIKAARVLEDFLWGKSNGEWGFEEWKRMFRKRVVKLDEINRDNPHAAVEVRKRLLQTAALAIALMAIVDEHGVPWDSKSNIPSNLPQYAESLFEP